jgi:hypothetical protein
MGRVQKQSNPTETSISIAGNSINPAQFAPLGDDALPNGGWNYVQQTYDWKGRPLVTTNQDGTTKTAEYTGCGCAGGEVVTLTDEGTIDGGVPKRRQQKIYSDVLGRVVKTEVLTWAKRNSVCDDNKHVQRPGSGYSDHGVCRIGGKQHLSGHNNDVRWLWPSTLRA